ncbi:hypothetical protein ACFLX4_01510 [Chloroflexota bacterium]
MGNAVDWFITQGVNVITCSIGWPIGGPGDGTGTICGIVDDARTTGILWSHSMGNSAQRHWQGDFISTDGDIYHEFQTTPSIDETNHIDVDYGDVIKVALKWDDPWGYSRIPHRCRSNCICCLVCWGLPLDETES